MKTQLQKFKFVSFLSLYLRLSAYNQVIPVASKQARAQPKEDAILYTLFFNAVNCIQCGEYFIQVYCIPYNVCCKLYTLNCILYAVYCTLYTVYYILCSVHRRAPWSFIGVQM